MVERAVLLTLWGILAAIYLHGWWRLRQRGAHRLANWQRVALAILAFGTLALAFLPPITTYENRSFFVHMIQHELLIEVAPTFLWLAHPVAFWLWGMPRRWRHVLTTRVLAPHTRARYWLRRLTPPRVVVPLYLTVVTLWHLPPIYDTALRVPLLHGLEHLSLWFTAVLYWWLVTAAPPQWHGHSRRQLPVVYVILAYLHNEILGVGLTLIRQPIYSFYERVSPPWGLSPLADQSLGGAVMWIPGEFIYAITLMALLFRLLEEREPYRGVYETYPG